MSLQRQIIRPASRLSLRWICRECQLQNRRLVYNKSVRCYSSGVTSPKSSSPNIYDVVIVGGGPAGLTLASALKSSRVTRNLKVALIEGQDLTSSRQWQGQDGNFSNRVSSLTPATVEFLKNIGVWSHINHERIQSFEEMQVWDGVSDTRIQFAWDTLSSTFSPSLPSSGPIIGTMCENVNLTHALLSHLSTSNFDDLSIYDNSKVQSIEYGVETEEMDLSAWPVVSLDNGTTLAARLLVGADGGNSPVRKFAEIESRGWEYSRHGFVATMEIEDADVFGKGRIAYQRFLPTGPIALLPLPGKYATLVWSTTPKIAAQMKTLSDEDFIAMVNAGFRLSHVDLEYFSTIESGIADEVSWRLQHTKFSTPPTIPTTITGVQSKTRASFPLKMSHADTYIAERIVLVGDAAHTVHPLAGQGLNSGQADVISLIKTLEFAVSHGQDVGSGLSLETYLADRYVKNNALLGTVDKLHKVYGTRNNVMVGLRSMGQELVQRDWLGVKGFFMKQAAGQ